LDLPLHTFVSQKHNIQANSQESAPAIFKDEQLPNTGAKLQRRSFALITEKKIRGRRLIDDSTRIKQFEQLQE
jgi:hypothetical protein